MWAPFDRVLKLKRCGQNNHADLGPGSPGKRNVEGTMRSQLRNIIVGVLLFGAADVAFAEEWKLPSLDPERPVKDIVADFRAAMSALIEQAGGESRVTLLRAFQLADSLIGNMQAAYGESVKLTFKELDKQQIKVFDDLSNLLNEEHNAVIDPVNHSLKGVDNFNAVWADVLSWNKYPIVTSYEPGHIPPDSVLHTIKITVSGERLYKLGADKPKIEIAGTTYDADSVTDTSIKFIVPHSAFGFRQSGTAFIRANLVVFRIASSWSDWLPWISPRQEKIPYPLVFNVLPEQLGSYRVDTIPRVNRLEEKDFKQPHEFHAEKWGGGAAQDGDCFTPIDGFEFDLTTVELVELEHFGQKDDAVAPGINLGGIGYEGKVKEKGRICVVVTANTNCKECGARTKGHLKAKMVRGVTEDGQTLVGVEVPIIWEDKEIKVDAAASSQVLHIRLFDEIPRIELLTRASSMQFLRIAPDARNNIVVLKPQGDWAAQ